MAIFHINYSYNWKNHLFYKTFWWNYIKKTKPEQRHIKNIDTNYNGFEKSEKVLNVKIYTKYESEHDKINEEKLMIIIILKQ